MTFILPSKVRAAFKHKTKVWTLTSSSSRHPNVKPFSSDVVSAAWGVVSSPSCSSCVHCRPQGAGALSLSPGDLFVSSLWGFAEPQAASVSPRTTSSPVPTCHGISAGAAGGGGGPLGFWFKLLLPAGCTALGPCHTTTSVL